MLIESLKQFKTDSAGLLFDCYISIDEGELSSSELQMSACICLTPQGYISCIPTL
jgi:hypothetical protein